MSLRKFLVLVLLFIPVVNASVLFDIPVMRQVSGFVFLALIPGFLLWLIFRLNELDWTEKIPLTMGLSIAFTTFFSLLINELLPLIGYTKPLAVLPLLISFSVATFVLVVAAYFRNRNSQLTFSIFRLSTIEKAFLVLPAIFPLLSIAGTRIMNLTANNIVLMALLFLIPTYVILVALFKSKITDKIYPAIIFLISISLLLVLAVRSNHIFGSDIHDWYYFFQSTMNVSHWKVMGPTLIDASISISLLPTVFQTFVNINPEYLFKLLFPVLFSVAPFVVYIISKKYIGSFYAFLASFFFMSQVVFQQITATSNTALAIFFFALAILSLLHEGMSPLTSKLLFIIFTAAAIVSHYSTSYIFLFVLAMSWIVMQIIHLVLPRRSKALLLNSEESEKYSDNNDTQPGTGKMLTITLVILFFVMLFFWYSQVTEAAFDISARFVYHILVSMNKWFIVEVETKGPTVAAAVGEGVNTLPQQIRFVFSWFTVGFIILGLALTAIQYRQMTSLADTKAPKPTFMTSRFDVNYVALTVACMSILAVTVVLPYVAVGYSMERTYLQMITVISPFFVVGGILLAILLRTVKVRIAAHWVILVILVPFFMSTTGTIYQILGFPTSAVLNNGGLEYNISYIYDQDSDAAKWLKEYGGNTPIYTGSWPAQRILESQGLIPSYQSNGSIVSAYNAGNRITTYLYLRRKDIVVDRLLTNYADLFQSKSKLYTTGVSEIYR